MNTLLLELGMPSKTGFLPEKPPLQRLPDSLYEPWEVIVDRLSELIEANRIQEQVHELPVFSTSMLSTETEWRRAYLLLSLMTQGYIWAGQVPSEILPPALSIPLIAVSAHLGLPPAATYAALNLWNFAPSPSVEADLCNPDNIKALHTFTGTLDESWFYAISNAIEARGGRMIPTMLDAMNAARTNNTIKASQALRALTTCLVELEALLERMYENCDPEIFYHRIRPLLAGTKNMSEAGLPRGVFYDEGEGRGTWRQYNGPSNVQSSLIPFFDVVLGVNHCAPGGSVTGDESGFLQEMRRYMPAQHARFLESLDSNTIRHFTMSHSADHSIVQEYNAAVGALTAFRNKHIQIVTRYIILPSKKSLSQTGKQGCSTEINGQFIPETSQDTLVEDMNLLGTGGTQLIPFLKQSRDDTKAAVIKVDRLLEKMSIAASWNMTIN